MKEDPDVFMFILHRSSFIPSHAVLEQPSSGRFVRQKLGRRNIGLLEVQRAKPTHDTSE